MNTSISVDSKDSYGRCYRTLPQMLVLNGLDAQSKNPKKNQIESVATGSKCPHSSEARQNGEVASDYHK